MKIKTCQRCQNEFNCNADKISNCSCFGVELSDATQTYLTKLKFDCLCTPCLEELNQIHEEIAEEKADAPLIENKHFYMENDLMVFTEYYHIKRGYCCKNDCRHCAYGF